MFQCTVLSELLLKMLGYRNRSPEMIMATSPFLKVKSLLINLRPLNLAFYTAVLKYYVPSFY